MKSMKKKVLFVGLLLVASITFTFYSHSREERMQDFILENIDALASDEASGNTTCIGSGSLDCPFNYAKVEYIIENYSLEGFN